MSELPRRDVPALIEALRIRALALTGELWERNGTRDMMKEAADQLEALQQQVAARTQQQEQPASVECAKETLRSTIRSEAGHIAYVDDEIDALIAAVRAVMVPRCDICKNEEVEIELAAVCATHYQRALQREADVEAELTAAEAQVAALQQENVKWLDERNFAVQRQVALETDLFAAEQQVVALQQAAAETAARLSETQQKLDVVLVLRYELEARLEALSAHFHAYTALRVALLAKIGEWNTREASHRLDANTADRVENATTACADELEAVLLTHVEGS